MRFLQSFAIGHDRWQLGAGDRESAFWFGPKRRRDRR
jgi:hypothetical protein